MTVIGILIFCVCVVMTLADRKETVLMNKTFMTKQKFFYATLSQVDKSNCQSMIRLAVVVARRKSFSFVFCQMP